MNQNAAIAEAAREPNKPRNNWLNPTEPRRKEVLEFPGSVDVAFSLPTHEKGTTLRGESRRCCQAETENRV